MQLIYQGSFLQDTSLLFVPEDVGSFHEGFLLLPDVIIALACLIIPLFLFYLGIRHKENSLRWLLLSLSALVTGCAGLFLVNSLTDSGSASSLLITTLKSFTVLAALITIAVLVWTSKDILMMPPREALAEKDQKLCESEAKFKSIFNSNLVGIALTNEKGYFTEANEKFAQLSGLSLEEITAGKLHWTDQTASEFKAKESEAFQEMLQTGQMIPFEKELIRKDGVRVPVLTGGNMLYGHQGAAFLLDQSAFRQVVKQLDLAEERFKLLTQATNDIIWDADFTSDQLWWNENYKKQFGYENAESDSETSWYSRVHPDDVERVSLSIQEAENSGHRQWSAEYRFRKANGEYAYILDRGYFLYDHASKPLRAIGSMVDVTALKQAHAEIDLAEERFRLVAKATNDFIFDWNLLNDQIWWNEQFLQHFGNHEGDKMTGHHSWTLRLHPDDKDRIWDSIYEAFGRKDKQWTAEYRFRNSHGYYTHILHRAYIIYQPNGEPFRMLGSLADLTPIIEAQEELAEKALALQQFNAELEERQSALRQSLSKFQAVFESNMIGICFLNLNGNIIDANHVFLDTLGFTREDLAGENISWIGITPPEYRDLDVHAKRELAEKGVNTPYEKEFTRKDGRRVPVIAGNAILNEFNNLCVGFTLDISQRKRAEQRLRRTLDELKKRNFELDNYVYKVSHDLRAPLASILGLINVFRIENSPDKANYYIDLIENRAKKLDNFIQSVLNHSRTNSTEIQIGEVDFKKIIADAFEELRYLPQSEQMELILDINQACPFYSDPLKVSIILKNFLSNAIKYSHPYKQSSFVKFSIRSTEREATISIEDNGLGIEPKYLSKIFDTFFRASEKSDGSGLGLYIVKQTIEKLGGTITADSQLGEGTIFYLKLPNLMPHEAENTGDHVSLKS